MYSLQPVSRCCQDVLSPFRHQTGWNLLIYQAEKRNFDFQKSELRFFISKNLLRGGFLQCQHLTDAISEHSHMTLDYFYGQAGELFSFYRIPKALFQEPRFQNLSTDAKTLYGILLDRMSLSAKNGWLDEQGRVFIIFTIEDVKRALCCADNKATKLLRELEKFGLIERKRRGQGKPSLVYVKNFSAESSKSIFQNRDFHDSGGFKNASQDPSKSRCNKTKDLLIKVKSQNKKIR